IDRVHGDAAVVRALAQPPAASRLADLHVDVLDVADLAHRRLAVEMHAPHLAGGEADRAPVALLGHELRRGPGGADDLPAGAYLELDVVDGRAERDVAQGQRIPRLDVRRLRGHHGVAHRKADRRQDVVLLPVGVVEERDARRAVRVVLDRRDLGRDARLRPLEVDLAVAALVAAAAEAHGDAPVDVAAAVLVPALEQRLLGRVLLLGDLREVLRGHAAAPGGRGLVFLDGHGPRLPRRTRSSAPPGG